MAPTGNLSIRVCTLLFTVTLIIIIFIHYLKVRADTTLTEGQWSDEVVVPISLSEGGAVSSDSSGSSSVPYIVVAVIVGVILIIVAIAIAIYLVRCYRNTKYHDAYVSLWSCLLKFYILLICMYICMYVCMYILILLLQGATPVIIPTLGKHSYVFVKV